MLKRGILNAQLRQLTARIGHRDRFAIVDAGYNVPQGIEDVDLAFLPNIPAILQVLDGILDEMEIEKVILALEIKEWSPTLNDEYNKRCPVQVEQIHIPHSEFDQEIKNAKGVIRTGQYGLHAPNIILQAGYSYDV
jgi:D-ribose pyranase